MNILPKSQYEKIFHGSQITTQHLKLVLEESGITSIIRDDGESALRAGYGADHTNDVKLFVDKKDVLKAKHIIANTVDHLDTKNIPDADLEELAKQKDAVIMMTKSTNTRKKETYRRSPFNVFINIIIIIYSAWRLSPLLVSESLPTWRIVLSGSLIAVCGWALINHFSKKV
ncbi:hypothetical protein [uncultured Dokdonia sp.]|uniref:hypothetical protein n=1 Tax=uncultured Dokdonia sp. TaxID=575653 RepID=UPI0026040371|nr:hypothetical protein [uncultured Dokdonia sp.]